MDYKKIRKGNYVKFGGKIEKVTSTVISIAAGPHSGDYFHIEITKNFLLKNNFHEIGNSVTLSIQGKEIMFDFNNNPLPILMMSINNNISFRGECQFWHEFQNIYFDKTNEELNIFLQQ